MAPWSLIFITSWSFLSAVVCSPAAQLHEQDTLNAEVLTLGCGVRAPQHLSLAAELFQCYQVSVSVSLLDLLILLLFVSHVSLVKLLLW